MPAHSSASSSKSLSNLNLTIIVSNVTVDDCDNSPFSSYQLFALKIKINLIFLFPTCSTLSILIQEEYLIWFDPTTNLFLFLKINSVLITFSLTTSLVNLSPDPIEKASIGLIT